MFCEKCGSVIPEGATFCPECGSPVSAEAKGATAPNNDFAQQQPVPAQYAQPAYQQPPLVDKKEGKGFAIAALVLGILSIVFCWMWWFIGLPFILAIIGLIFAIVALAKKSDGKGIAIGGLITSIVGFILSIVVVIISIFAVTSVVTSTTDPKNWESYLDDLDIEYNGDNINFKISSTTEALSDVTFEA